MQQAPVVPPRPARGQEKGNGSSAPTIPPRPVNRRLNRSISPNPDRFAPSPLNEGAFAPKSPQRPSLVGQTGSSHLAEQMERPASVEMPGPGEEGQEYALLSEHPTSTEDLPRNVGSPEHTSTVGEDVHLHAPKPTMAAHAAKQRVATVTRTDSERAASFGIGMPSSQEAQPPVSNVGLRKKPSSTSQLSQREPEADGDEQGIPEIGRQVPMYPNAGDVQAPSPAPGSALAQSQNPQSRPDGFGDLPPGSYGRHGHGVAATDKLQKAYYEKHPELARKQHYNQVHDRASDFAMSSEDLNKIVRDTASRGAGFGTSATFIGTPSEQVGFQASDEYASRMTSSPSSAAPGQDQPSGSPLKQTFSGPENSRQNEDDDVIHVDEHGARKGFAKYGDPMSAEGAGAEGGYETPILASDEVAKHHSGYESGPAVEPPPQRSGSAFEMEEPKSHPASRPTSVHSPPPSEMRTTPLADVKEYEPLFKEDEKHRKTSQTDTLKQRTQRFPSRDIWEDAPNSVHATAEVSTPEPRNESPKLQGPIVDVPPREGETPAQAFARRQEELAEKEAKHPDGFLWRTQRPAEQQLKKEKAPLERPNVNQRFPSRDVWEDTPDSLQFTTTVSGPQSARETADEQHPSGEPSASARPAVPARPPKKQGSVDDKPVLPDRPKPQVPVRPSKPATESKESEPIAKQKPAVPARPVGSKIAALQAGFMSDLNKRLQLGPNAPKKDAPAAQEPLEEKEKVPLSDARKGRARGPQRRAPSAKSPSPAGAGSGPPPASSGKPVLSFSTTRMLFSIDEEGTMTVGQEPEPSAQPEPEQAGSEQAGSRQIKAESEKPAEAKPAEAKPAEDGEKALDDAPPESQASESKAEETQTPATNTAGESVLEETVEKTEPGGEVAEVKGAGDEAKS